MAVLTLRKINDRLDFDDSSQVKITRRAVKLTILASRVARSNNSMLRMLFYVAGRPLPGADPALARLRARSHGSPT